jgi:aquaporin Z
MGSSEREADLRAVSRSELARPLLAEALGVFALTTVDAGGTMIAEGAPFEVSAAARAAAAGLVIMSFTYALAEISGAHFNPAVTLAFAVRRVFPWTRAIGYVVAQVLGAVVGALVLRALLGDVAHVGATMPGPHGPVVATLGEALLVFLLVTVELATAHRHKVIGPHSALATGAAMAAGKLVFRPVSGASLNPARSLGCAIVGGVIGSYPPYLAGPLVGALAAVAVMRVLHPTPRGWEAEAAGGDQAATPAEPDAPSPDTARTSAPARPRAP